jgi:hypothetical protein
MQKKKKKETRLIATSNVFVAGHPIGTSAGHRDRRVNILFGLARFPIHGSIRYCSPRSFFIFIFIFHVK